VPAIVFQIELMNARFFCYLLACVALWPAGAASQSAELPRLAYQPVAHFLELPIGGNFGEAAGVAINSRGHLFIFHRGPSPLMEFDANGCFVRSIGEGLFTRPHGLRIDREDNIWTTDVGSHLVLKFNSEGRVLLVLGRQGVAGESDALFNQPSDVAFSPMGEIFVTDGYGNSRVVKFDKEGNFLKAWGRKGTAPGEFDLPHTIAIDARGRVYVGDRENQRVQIFDGYGNFVQEWRHVGHPWGLFITPEQVLYLADGRANRVLQLDLNGNILGVLGGPGKAPGQFAYAHGIAVGASNEIYIAEILNWRVQKFVSR
jgi:DNA-binding beta-propeller fold protein YncE